MALSYGFYNAFDHDRKYNAVQFSRIFDGIITDGIYATYMEAMQVKASENANEVVVGPGRAWFLGTWSYNDADLPVAAPDPEVVLDRIDTLVLDVNTEQAARANSYIWVQGTPTSQTPVAPTLINTDTHKQYPLCDVYRQAGTTQIYTENITNRRGTSACPFVTGVLETINVDNLLAQWDAEFHTWENATKVSFEGWMLNQQTVYTAWWDALKDQMSDDVQDVEDWIETIRGIIDSETATHLQLEIDEINEMLPAGSHITVTTLNSELFSRTVTITDEDNHTVTTQFNSSGVAVFKTVPYVGNLTITSTDGTRTATAVVNTPYFARYAFNLAFWSATVNLNGDSELGGVTVTVKDSDNTTVTAIVLNASGDGVFSATYPDTYKFIYTYGGQTMEVSLAVTQETTYNVTIHGGFNYSGWLTAGRVSGTYADLDAVLADEEAVRQLMLVHDAVDYLASANVNADVEKIFNNDICAKWINLSDYALDTFYAVSDIKDVMDEADKYGYGEWVITDDTTTPVTWGPKGNVPIMTSDTTPYGVVNVSSNLGGAYISYGPFSGGSSMWYSANTSGPHWIQYKFINPVCVKRYHLMCHIWSTNTTVKLQASNDGFVNDVHDLAEHSWNQSNPDITENIDNDNYYLYYRVNAVNTTEYFGVSTLQFYGRELSVSVPKMDTNTTPYGEAICENNSITGANKVFDRVLTNDGSWMSSTGSEHYIGYDFGTKVKVMAFFEKNRVHSENINAPKDYTLQGYDGTSWETIETYTNANNTSGNERFHTINPNKAYSKYRLNISTFFGNQGYVSLCELQFYGLDYSEKEFEVGTTKKWLYDHGVELETIGLSNSFKLSDHLQIGDGSTNAFDAVYITSDVGLDDYDLVRVKIGLNAYNSQGGHDGRISMFVSSTTPPPMDYTQWLAETNAETVYNPNNRYLSIPNVNSGYPGIGWGWNYYTQKYDIVEWWLE